jgi:hypothetical protein
MTSFFFIAFILLVCTLVEGRSGGVCIQTTISLEAIFPVIQDTSGSLSWVKSGPFEPILPKKFST